MQMMLALIHGMKRSVFLLYGLLSVTFSFIDWNWQIFDIFAPMNLVSDQLMDWSANLSSFTCDERPRQAMLHVWEVMNSTLLLLNKLWELARVYPAHTVSAEIGPKTPAPGRGSSGRIFQWLQLILGQHSVISCRNGSRVYNWSDWKAPGDPFKATLTRLSSGCSACLQRATYSRLAHVTTQSHGYI